jgi:hypothetical protein
MDWESELKVLITEFFKSREIKYTPNTKRFDCLTDFVNLEMKTVKAFPRTVFKSKKVKSLSLPPEISKALAYIEDKFKKGIDVTFHLSKNVLAPSYNDRLLNEWRIHHLHLSDKKKAGSKYYERSKHLLFVAFTTTQVLFIDVRDHNEEYLWAKKELLEIIYDNWYDILKPHKENDIKLSENYSDADIFNLRKNGYMIGMTEIRGETFWNPGIGMASDGTSILVNKKADAIHRYLHYVSEEIKNSPTEVMQTISEGVGYAVEELCFSLRMLDRYPYFGFFENNTQVFYNVIES